MKAAGTLSELSHMNLERVFFVTLLQSTQVFVANAFRQPVTDTTEPPDLVVPSPSRPEKKTSTME